MTPVNTIENVIGLKEELVRAKFVNRISIGFTDEQFDWLCDSVRKGFAEDLASSIRKLVNEKIATCAHSGDKQ